jgi:hypothetical protein
VFLLELAFRGDISSSRLEAEPSTTRQDANRSVRRDLHEAGRINLRAWRSCTANNVRLGRSTAVGGDLHEAAPSQSGAGNKAAGPNKPRRDHSATDESGLHEAGPINFRLGSAEAAKERGLIVDDHEGTGVYANAG